MPRHPRRLGIGALCVGAALASVAHTVSGPRLDHWHTSASISRALGARRVGERCELVYAAGMSLADVERLAAECEAYVEEIERWLGAAGPPRVRVYVFESAAQKQRLMGAAHTNIAKPWRAEVYVQGTSYPHRVLGHELAHVLASGVAKGPFAIAGRFGGLVPDPGLIEGLAVAASPRDEDLSAEEWARAMKDLGVLPPLRRLFALGFLGENSSTAYTASGAFVAWIREQHGAAVIRDWYGGAPLDALTGATWAELEERWHASLDRIELPPSAAIVAEARFKRPGFFGRSCPRTVDACRERAEQLAGDGDLPSALAELDRASRLDPRDPRIRLERTELLAKLGEPGARRDALAEVIGDEGVPRQLRDRALERFADLALAEGRVEEAAGAYEAIAERTLDEARLRTLHVKLAATRDEGLRPAVTALLVGRDGNPERSLAFTLLGELRLSRPDDGTAWYLVARARYDAGDWQGALHDLERALERELPVPRVEVEALRLAVLASCSVGDSARAERWLTDYARHPDARPARRTTLARVVARCGAEASRRAGERGLSL